MKITDEAVEAEFQRWWRSSKYCQVILPQPHLEQYARDGFRAAVAALPHLSQGAASDSNLSEPITEEGPEVVERLRKWCSETINQWSDEYEPRENWERQVSGAMREWDKATTEIITDYKALRTENERLRAASIASGNALYEARVRSAELVKALEWYGEQARLARLIHGEGDKGRNALAADGGKRARAALKGQSNEA